MGFPLLLLDPLTTGFRYLLKHDWCNSISLVPESSKAEFVCPYSICLFWGIFNSFCIILTLACVEIVSFLMDQKNSILSSLFGRALSLGPLPGSLDKGVSSLSDCLMECSIGQRPYWPPSPLLANLLFRWIQFALRWLVSLQYWQNSSVFKEPSAPGDSCDGHVFPWNGFPPTPVLLSGWLFMPYISCLPCDLIYQLLTTCVIAWAKLVRLNIFLSWEFSALVFLALPVLHLFMPPVFYLVLRLVRSLWQATLILTLLQCYFQGNCIYF